MLFSSDLETGIGQQYSVRVTDKQSRDDFLTFCRISPDEIVMVERVNRRLKKLSNSYKVTESVTLNDWPFDICSIGNGKCLVAFPERKLQLVNVQEEIELANTIHIAHDCMGLIFYEGHLYIADTKSVYLYSLDGIMIRSVYTHNSPNTLFRQITISSDGSKIYITNYLSGLLIIDLASQDAPVISFLLPHAEGVALDDEGNILLCGCRW